MLVLTHTGRLGVGIAVLMPDVILSFCSQVTWTSLRLPGGEGSICLLVGNLWLENRHAAA